MPHCPRPRGQVGIAPGCGVSTIQLATAAASFGHATRFLSTSLEFDEAHNDKEWYQPVEKFCCGTHLIYIESAVFIAPLPMLRAIP